MEGLAVVMLGFVVVDDDVGGEMVGFGSDSDVVMSGVC